MKFLGIEISSEERSDLDATSDRWYSTLLEAFTVTGSGAIITPDTSIRITAVYNAVKIITEAVSSLPFVLYKRTTVKDREPEYGHDLFSLLSLKPNHWQTWMEFSELMTLHLLLRGNAYAQIVPSRDTGQISKLIPLHPDDMKVETTSRGFPKYVFKRQDGTTRVFQYWQIFHLRNLSLDGLTGLSPIELNREALGVARSAEDYSARFYGNDSTPGGVLEHPGRLDEKVHNRLKASWQQAHQGTKKSHKAAILEEGMTWKPISISARDAQFIEARQFQIEEIARIFNLPPHMLKDLRNATFTNIEAQDLSFLKHSLRPWLIRWQQAVQRDLISLVDDTTVEGTQLPALFAEFDSDVITRADIKTRNDAHATAIQHGYMSINEVRAENGLNPIEGGDIHLLPLNMVPLDRLDEVDFGDSSGSNPGGETDENDNDDNDRSYREQSRNAFKRMFTKNISRLVRKEIKEIQRVGRQGKDLGEWSEEFYPKHAAMIEDALEEAATAYVEQLSLADDILGKRGEEARNAANTALDLFIEKYIDRAKAALASDGEEATNRWDMRPDAEADSLISNIEAELFNGGTHVKT